MKLLPHHRFRYVAIIFGVVAVCYGGLHVAGHRDNGRIEAHKSPNLPYAGLVEVEAGAEYFFTWGVTASPGMKEIALGGVENRYGDTYQQSYAVLTQLASDLAEVGLSLRDVVNVRAYIVADPEPDFDAWNRAFRQFFGTATNPHKPARTTLGISRLFHSDYRVEVEFTAVFPVGRGPHVAGTRQSERYARLGRAETSDRWKSYGRPVWPMSTGKATREGTGMYFSSSVRPESLLPNPPPGMHLFGNISQQSASLFKQMKAQLSAAGLDYKDVFFIRACVYPGAQSIGKSFASFNAEYEKHFNNKTNPNRPTRTVMSTPGFNYKKQSISIEYYAAYPEDSPRAMATARESIGTTPSALRTEDLGPAGTAVASDARILFVSGCVADSDGTIAEQAQSALATLERRLALGGAALSDLVQVRAYIAEADPKTLDNRIAAWETLYGKSFDTETAPALTTLPVVSLPGGRAIELEAMAALRD